MVVYMWKGLASEMGCSLLGSTWVFSGVIICIIVSTDDQSELLYMANIEDL